MAGDYRAVNVGRAIIYTSSHLLPSLLLCPFPVASTVTQMGRRQRMTRRTVSSLYGCLVAAWLLLAAFFGWRVLDSVRNPTPELIVDDELRIGPNPLSFSPTVLSDWVGHRVIRAGGVPVSDRAAMRAALRRPPYDLVLQTPSGQHLRVLWMFRANAPRVELDPDGVVRAPPSPAIESTGLRPGDRITRVGGEVLGSSRLPDLRGYRGLLRLDVERSGLPFTVVLEPFDWRVPVVELGAAIAFGLIGVVAFRLRPDTLSAWAFLWFTLCCSALWLLRAVPFWSKDSWERQLQLGLRLLLPAATIYLLVCFSPLRRLGWSSARAVGLAVAATAALAVWHAVAYPQFVWVGGLAGVPGRIWLLLMLGLALAGLASDLLVRAARGSLPAIDRQRGHALRLAVAAGFLPLTIALALRLEPRFPYELTALLFPLVLAYTTVRHNIFQFNHLLLEGMVYGTLLLGLGVAAAVLVAGVVPLVRGVLGSVLGDVQHTWLTFAVVGGATLAALPLHARVRERLDQWFERSSLDERSLAQDVDVDTLSMSSPREYCERIIDRFAKLVGVADVRILVRHPETGAWWLAAASRLELPGPRLEECGPLFAAVVEGRELVRDVLEEDLTATQSEAPLVRAMNALGASLVFPLVVSGEVWGALTVGEKQDATNFSFGELRSIRRLARECALGLYQAHLLFGPGDERSPPLVTLRDLLHRQPASVGPYRIDRLVGEGGMAMVYRAERVGSSEPAVAVKVLHRTGEPDPAMLLRFDREARILERLRHPNVVEMLDHGIEPEPYLVVEYFSRGTLRDLLRQRKYLSEQEAWRCVLDVAAGLSAALRLGVVHRDVNPRNVFLAEDGRAKIGDFGIAHWEGATTLTATDQMIGTPGYLSPEGCRGGGVDWRADQYALGVVLYELLAGKRPYRGARVLEVLAMHLHGDLPNVREVRPDVSTRTAQAIQRMMAKRPEERFASYEELGEWSRG
jgi:GAF domain-containing protein